MELFKRKDGKSPFWFFDAIDERSGLRVRRSTKRTDKREAMREALRMITEEPSNEITLAAALTAYSGKLKADGKPSWVLVDKVADKMLGRSSKTQTGAERWADRFKLDGSRRVSSLTRGDVEAMRVARAREGNSPATLANELRTLRAACRYASDCGFAPCKVTKWAVPKDSGKFRYLSHEEARQGLAAIHPDTPIKVARTNRFERPTGKIREWRQDAHDLLLAYIVTGGRAMEVNRLTTSQVDLGKRVVRLWGKGDKAREVPLVTEALDMFTRRVTEARSEKRALLFPGIEGKVRHAGSRAVRRALDAAGANDPEVVRQFGTATIHSLRHTYASWLRHLGIELDELQPLLGHTTLAMTMRYAEVRPETGAMKVHDAFGRVGKLDERGVSSQDATPAQSGPMTHS